MGIYIMVSLQEGVTHIGPQDQFEKPQIGIGYSRDAPISWLEIGI